MGLSGGFGVGVSEDPLYSSVTCDESYSSDI